MSQLKPVTPITAQLEKLLSPASVHPPHSTLAHAPTHQPAATTAAPPVANAHPLEAAESGAGTDPSAALDNLFAAKFSFQFDNLQHILRYILGEIRNQKRQTLDVAMLKERVSGLESTSETVSALLNQSNTNVKQTATLQGEVGKLEDKLTKDTSLLNRRVATLEVTCERMATSVTDQEQKLTQSLSKQSSAASLTPAQTALATGGADNPFLPVGRKEGLEMDNMSSSISKLLQSQGAATAQLLERVKKLEEKEVDLKKEADTVHASMALLQNENKRLQTALQNVEEELKSVKKGNDLTNATIGQVQATVAAVSRRSSLTKTGVTASAPAPLHPQTPSTPVTAPVTAPSVVAAKVATPPMTAAPAPAMSTSSSNSSINFAVNLDAGRQQMLRATESSASLTSNASSDNTSAPAATAAPASVAAAAAAAGIIIDDGFESDLATMQANFEVKVLTQLAELRKELDDKWSVEKEISRENKKQVMDALSSASEAALEAKAAFEHTKAAGEEIEARIAKIPAPKPPSLEEDEQLAQRLLEQAAEANLVLFAGVESVTSKSPGLKPHTPSGITGQGHSRRPSFNLSAPASSPTPPLGTDRPPPHSGASSPQVTVHHAHPHHSYNFSQQDFDRVKAMAELALRRTVQHSEVISQVESSGFKKDPAQAVTLLDLEKVKANASNVATRMLYLEDKLETINALTLATRNQTLALQTSVEDNPAFKSVHLRLFEYELKQNEIGDKVKLLAHMLQKGGISVPMSPISQTHTLSQSHGNVADLQQKSSSNAGSNNKANAQNRSLVSQLEEDEKARKDANKAKKEAAAAAAKQEQKQAEADEVSDDESIRGSSQASMRPPSVAGGRSHQRAASKLPSGDTISEAGNAEVATATITSGDGNEEVEATSVGYTDGLDEARSSLAMVLREADIPARSVEQLTKDLKALGHMHEKLSAVEALDAKLATIASLEAKVESLLDMDIKERLTFIERRFNTELTFLRSHVNTKVDASSLNILLNKLDFEGAIAGGAVVAGGNERATSPRKIAIGGGRGHEDTSPSRVDAAAVAASINHPTHSLADGQKGSMGRASGREARGKAASDVEKAARDRKQRLAHLLAMLDKKADHASIRALEEFVRSVDRHLRGMLARHSAQFKQLEANGILQPGKIVKKRTGKPSTAGGSYDEEKARADGEDMTIHPHESLYDSHEDIEFSEAEIDYVVSNSEDMPSRRQAVSDMLQAAKVAKKNSAEEDAATAARVGFTISNSSSQYNQLHRRCEDLQMQIANLHSQLAKKQDRSNHGIGLHSRNNSSMHMRGTSADFSAGAGAGAASVGTPAAAGPVAGGHPGAVSLTPASLDELTLNPDLSLVDHPHYIRLATKSQMHEEELARVQSLVLYQSKQLRNHREWIAKHSREIGAIRQYVQFAQSQQAANVAAITSPTGGSQTTRNANENTSLTNVAVATSASYPSPAVFQILRQVEADILSLRRTMKQKIDFMDLGITNPHDQSQALPVSTNNYPHPSLEDLRRLLFYLTPQLSAGAGLPLGGGGGGGPHGFAHQAGYSGTDANRVSMLATKGAHHVPPLQMNSDGTLTHTHGPGGPETWKCLACDRAMEAMNTVPPAKLSRHKDMTATLSSVAPAGGVAGANTRRLIAAASPQALFQQSQSAKVPSSSQQMQPRPPNQAAGAATPRAAAAQLAAAQTAVVPSKSIVEQQALLLQQQQQLLLQQQQQQQNQITTGSNLTDPAYQAQLQAAREAETQQLVAAQIKAMKEQEKEERAVRKAEKKRVKAQLKAEAEAKALLEAQAQAKEQERAERAKAAAAASATQVKADEPEVSSVRPTSASTRTTVAEVTVAAMEAKRNSPSFDGTAVSVVSPSGRVRSIDFVEVVEQARMDQLGKDRLTETSQPEEKADDPQ